MLTTEILGRPPDDNALWVTADNGRGVTSVVFDCGANTISSMAPGDIMAIDHLFLSHQHMDHISGFDAFFRMNHLRKNRENHIWGPPGTAAIIQHRFQGYWWSHAHELEATWYVHDVDAQHVRSYRYKAREAFAIAHDAGAKAWQDSIVATPQLQVTPIALQHHGLCLGYVAREADRVNIDMDAVRALGLPPGPWMAQLRDGEAQTVEIAGTAYDADQLRTQLIHRHAGDAVAYLTDFRASPEQRALIAPQLAGVRMMFAEAQYAPRDHALAEKYDHSTVEEIALLAAEANVEQYRLIHLSRRYQLDEWRDMRTAAQAIFSRSDYDPRWGID
jgi:ribonuclease Z